MPLKMLCDRTLQFLGERANLAFGEVTDSFFDLAEGTPDAARQASCFDAINLLRADKAEIVDEWTGAVAAAFDDLVFATMAGNGDQGAGPAFESMGLADSRALLGDDLEEIVAFDQMVATANECNHPALHLLQQRMGKVVKRTINLQQLPLSPEFLTEQFVKVLRSRGLSVQPKLSLMALFDRLVLGQLPEVLSQCNQLLEDLGVLPGLKFDTAARGVGKITDSEKPNLSLNARPEQRFGTASPFPPQLKLLARNKVSRVDKTEQLNAQQVQVQQVQVQEVHVQKTQIQEVQTPGTDARNNSRSNGESPPSLGFPVRLLSADPLGAAKQGQIINGARQASGVSRENLLDCLKNASTPRAFSGNDSGVKSSNKTRGEFQRPEGAIRHHIECFLSQQGQCCSDLESSDQKAIVLMDQLFGEVHRRLANPLPRSENNPHQLSAQLASLLARIELPATRWALAEPAFFARDQHPLRRFLNEVCRVAACLCGVDEPAEDPLYKQLDDIVSRFAAITMRPIKLCDLLSDLIKYIEADRRRSAALDKSLVDEALAEGAMNLAQHRVENTELETPRLVDIADNELPGPDDDNLFRQIDCLKKGTWIGMEADRDGALQRWRMIGLVQASEMYIFGDRAGLKTVMLSRNRLAMKKKEGKLVLLDVARLFDTALSAAT